MEGFDRDSRLRNVSTEPPSAGAVVHPPARSGTASAERPLFWQLGLLAAVVALFMTSPRHGDFWWSDAPRHALNGVFLLDLLRELPLADPAGFAKNWYAHYPALSILFYPPLFALSEVPVYALFGVSHGSAQLTVALYMAALALGIFALARRFLSPAQAFAATLLFLGGHEIARWGRQVMLEIPLLAWLVWAALSYLRYLDNGQLRFLYGLALCALGALYTKQTAAFLVAVLGALLLFEQGGTLLRQRGFRLAALGSAVALVPLAVLTVKFGQTNLGATTGETGAELSRLSWANWSYYAEQLPRQLGWPVLILALLYPIARLYRPERRLPAVEERLLAAWVLGGYGFFSLIALKEPRHSAVILLPIVLFAVAALARWWPARAATPVLLALATGQLFYALAVDRPPAIGGYDQAAAFVADAAPPQSTILFSGYRDGSFVFNLRARDDGRKLGVLRSDKLLLRVKVKRELGVEQRGLTQEQLAAALNRYGVSYVVNEPLFWNDLEAMQVLQAVLHTPQFVKVGEIAVTGNLPHQDRVLEIYRNLQYTPGSGERPPLELLIIDQVI